MEYWVEVAFKLPMKQLFTYTASQLLAIGARVVAPFGSRDLVGFVVASGEGIPRIDYTLKPIKRLLDKGNVLFEPSYLEFATYLARYNFCSLGEALFAMTPSGRKEIEPHIITLSVAQPIAPEALTDSQKRAIMQMQAKVGWYYLFGHTGSGKTAVFMLMIADALRRGKQAIYLLPEIALVASVLGLLERQFGKERVAVLHSGLSPSKRLHQWQRILKGEVDIVLGVRSAIFAPLKNLGLIILDEEHDPSYKSQATPRFHARQVAMYLARKGSDVTLIMGSATPSLEAYHAMLGGVIERVDLVGFAGGGRQSVIELIDMKLEESQSVFSKRAVDEIWQSKKLGRQSLIFINRRGYGRYYLCPNCRYEAFCPHCSVSLTYYRDKDRMLCHYCGYTQAKIESCPACGSLRGGYKSFGVEVVEQEAKRIFGGLKILRLDSDSVRQDKSQLEVVAAFERGEADLLIGTQMLAKGFNFPLLRAVVIVSADVGLNLPDFRATERLFTFLQQVAGRAGRYEELGLVLAQSYVVEQSALQYTLNNDTEGFLRKELEARRETGFPPFSRMLRLVFRGANEDAVIALAESSYQYWSDILTNYGLAVEMLGPSEAVLRRIAGKYRWQIIFMVNDYPQFMQIFSHHFDSMPKRSGVYCEIENDPLTLL
ncbi:replication restart helicase PriA [Entomospira culicis]|uniref:Replication restart protein PriA n=1 Tax=Entomospira culicis TaxID=2719989 RepID=A0A968KTU6_9SPIO|nr:primosomal protein N' [Entomospira culicis]NIZ18609.1 primosomal protein N' [Entomospira culicis]NIZ68824.1 primosomal protein N' [Entomospira culicis]WDI37418.1 primosomal protein N' [Entomospira culicis]WDI39046.1 primosomal protein N' [Entomospira culicis]